MAAATDWRTIALLPSGSGMSGASDEFFDLTASEQNNGDTTWRRPNYATIHRMIDNPIYGGCASG
jgi:hypothetical protein